MLSSIEKFSIDRSSFDLHSSSQFLSKRDNAKYVINDTHIYLNNVKFRLIYLLFKHFSFSYTFHFWNPIKIIPISLNLTFRLYFWYIQIIIFLLLSSKFPSFHPRLFSPENSPLKIPNKFIPYLLNSKCQNLLNTRATDSRSQTFHDLFLFNCGETKSSIMDLSSIFFFFTIHDVSPTLKMPACESFRVS